MPASRAFLRSSNSSYVRSFSALIVSTASLLQHNNLDIPNAFTGFVLGILEEVFLDFPEDFFPFVHQRFFQRLFEVLRRLYAPAVQQEADENECEAKLKRASQTG